MRDRNLPLPRGSFLTDQGDRVVPVNPADFAEGPREQTIEYVDYSGPAKRTHRRLKFRELDDYGDGAVAEYQSVGVGDPTFLALDLVTWEGIGKPEFIEIIAAPDDQ